MAKKSNRQQAANPYPETGYTIRPTFLDVVDRDSRPSKQGKGVLELMQIRKPSGNASGDIKLRFLSSNTHATHSNLLSASGYDIGAQPIVDINWQGMPFSVAARYTARPEKRGPLEVAVMMAGATGSVEDQRGYSEVRRIVALGCGIAAVKHEFKGDGGRVGIELNVIKDFATPHMIRHEAFIAENLTDLAQQLH